MTDPVFVQAREFAAAFLDGMRRQDLALMVRAGEGDDFPEVITAAALLEGLGARNAHQEQALRAYADAEFWDEELPAARSPCTIRAPWRATCWLGANRTTTASSFRHPRESGDLSRHFTRSRDGRQKVPAFAGMTGLLSPTLPAGG